MSKKKPILMLKTLRAKHNVTQVQMSEMLGISSNAYCQKENGRSDFTITECRKIATYFNESPTKIFFTD